MTVRIWQSYSCNNSSSFRLIARFADAKTAGETAKELAAFFKQHALERDALLANEDWDSNTPAATALAKQYGLKWKYVFGWGDEMLVGDEPEVAVEHTTLAVYHGYCGGFAEIPKYLEKRGAKVTPEDQGGIGISVLFALDRGANKKLDKELAALAGPAEDRVIPWKATSKYTDAVGYRDDKSAGFYTQGPPDELAAIRTWLAARKVEGAVFRLGEDSDADAFTTISGAKCSACTGTLTYLDPRLEDVPTPQLACVGGCGGMFELSTYVSAMIKAREAERKRKQLEAGFDLERRRRAKGLPPLHKAVYNKLVKLEAAEGVKPPKPLPKAKKPAAKKPAAKPKKR